MIHYQLRCSTDHEFDGWFKDSTSFDKQAKHGLLECPVCGDIKVERALMAPMLPKKANQKPDPSPPATTETKAIVPERIPAQVRALLQRVREEVEKNADYVGDEFADEARRIHNGEADARAIYGEASSEDAEALADEGIDIARIPWLPLSDS